MKISKEGLNLIKKYEGCQLKAYKDPVGILTIGYGHTGNVKEGQKLTQAQADELLKKDVERFEKGVDKLVKVEINQHQFDSLVSFSFNLGLGNLEKSTLLKKVNAKDFRGASEEFARWNKADGQVFAGLTKRRNSESFLFKKPVVTAPVKVHVVKSGENLTVIAKKYKVTVSGLVKLNNIKDKNLIRIGQKIRVK